jgi:hypothetical protein
LDLIRLQTAMARALVLGMPGDLTDEEARYFAGIAQEDLRDSAEALFRKRLKAIRKLLPLSAKHEPRFEALFRTWIATHLPEEYRREARAFATDMARDAALGSTIREIFRYEAAGWDCVVGRRRRFGLFRVRIPDGTPGTTIAIWTRPGDRRPRLWLFSIPITARHRIGLRWAVRRFGRCPHVLAVGASAVQ